VPLECVGLYNHAIINTMKQLQSSQRLYKTSMHRNEKRQSLLGTVMACVVCMQVVRPHQHATECDDCGRWCHRTCQIVKEVSDYDYCCKFFSRFRVSSWSALKFANRLRCHWRHIFPQILHSVRGNMLNCIRFASDIKISILTSMKTISVLHC